MNPSTIIGLVNNVALLLALGLIYGLIGYRARGEKLSIWQGVTGVGLGVIGIVVMLTPWEFMPGVVLDTRSVLLSVSGLFFGLLPTLVATLMTSAFRLYNGGPGAWTGVAVIVSSGAIGVAWRHLRHRELEDMSIREMYGMGLVVHLAMWLWMFTLPSPLSLNALSQIGLPVMVIFPMGTALLGWLMVHQGTRKQIEEALRESEIRFLTMVKSSRDAIGVSRTGFQMLANPAYLQMFGYEHDEELIGTPVINHIALSEQEKVAAYIQARVRGEYAPAIYETRGLRKDGSEFDMAVHAFTYVLNGDVYTFVILRDITERKRTEEALRISETRYRMLFERASDAIFLVDLDTGYYLDANAAAERLTGRSAEELKKLTTRDITLAQAEERLKQIIASEGAVDVGEVVYVRPDGSTRILLVSAVPLNEKIAFSLARDITERKQTEAALRASEERFRATITQSRDGIVIADENFRIIEWSAAQTGISGYTREEMLAKPLWDFHYLSLPDEQKSPALRETLSRNMLAARTEGDADWLNALQDFEIQDREGNRKIIEVATFAVTTRDSNLYGSISRDVTKRKQAEEALRQSETRYRQIFETNQAIKLIIDPADGRIIEANQAAYQFYGYDAQTLTSLRVADITALPDEEVQEAMERAKKEEQLFFNFRHRLASGEIRDVEIYSGPVQSGGTTLLYSIIHDVTERKQAEMALHNANVQLQIQLDEIKELQTALREQAIRDPLTGLFNRRYMEEMLKQEYARAVRKQQILSIVLLDLDHLKAINDTYGHITGGDKALQTLAKTLTQYCRAEDTLCRYGGDEFVVILYDTSAQVARERALQWQKAVTKIKLVSDGKAFGVAFSAGVAAFPTHSLTCEEIILHADHALYRAKDMGRNQVVVYS